MVTQQNITRRRNTILETDRIEIKFNLSLQPTDRLTN